VSSRGPDRLLGLLPGARPNGLAEELDRVYPQDIRQLPDDLQTHLGHRPLDPAHEADRLRGTLAGKKVDASACTKPSNLWFDSPRLFKGLVRQT
jgi:hypothetical protein